jgi:homoserine kinase type II
MESSGYRRVLRNWGVAPVEHPATFELQGSPDRTVSRVAILDEQNQRWVLEEIGEHRYSRKLEIADTIEILQSRGLKAIHPYHRNSLGQFVTCYAGHLYMLRPYINGIPLDREKWKSDARKGESMADFLIEMRHLSAELPEKYGDQPFSVFEFIHRRMDAFRKHRPEMAEGLLPVFQGLEKTLFPLRSSHAIAFCHGDFHPLNVIWGEHDIQSVIDWEFCATKPETYDAALLVGCIGFNNPDALIDDFTIRIIQRLRDGCIYEAESWDAFYDMVIAIRYCWLSEWMRTSDESARDLELLYMNLLTAQKGYILGKWGF